MTNHVYNEHERSIRVRYTEEEVGGGTFKVRESIQDVGARLIADMNDRLRRDEARKAVDQAAIEAKRKEDDRKISEALAKVRI